MWISSSATMSAPILAGGSRPCARWAARNFSFSAGSQPTENSLTVGPRGTRTKRIPGCSLRQPRMVASRAALLAP